MRWNASELNSVRSYVEDLVADFEEMRTERDNLLEEIEQLNGKLLDAAKDYADLERELDKALGGGE